MGVERIVIIGGGVMGLSLAYDLSAGRRDPRRTITLLERDELGSRASWAGAGILTPPATTPRDPVAALRKLSHDLLPEWSKRLRRDTGIDNGFLRCGSWHLADPADPAGDQALEEEVERWRYEGVEHDAPTAAEIKRLEPALASGPGPVYRAPGEAQIRNPRHLRALATACAAAGVELRTGTPAIGFEGRNGSLRAVRTPSGRVAADRAVIAAGSWSPELAGHAGLELPGKPVRGQIVLLESPAPLISRIVWAGSRYLVPRPDGLLLVGSTEEDAGFDARPTAAGIAGLLALAERLVPATAATRFVRAWAGLRPGSPDALPVLGAVPGWEGLYLASGLFRSGFELSAGSARVLARLITGGIPDVDVSALAAERFAGG